MPTEGSETRFDNRDRDPEIAALSKQVHMFTGQIKSLVTEIDKTIVLLVARSERAAIEEQVRHEQQ